MAARIGTLAVDGTPISQSDLARIEAEERLHADQQRRAVRVVAGNARDAEDCRLLLSVLGLDGQTIVTARTGTMTTRSRKRRAAAA